jgi:CRISPR-associated endonuclease/helicase Cas3
MKFPEDIFLAHTAESTIGSPRAHELAEHLRQVSEGAANNAAAFGGADWARLAGLWHDLGKYRPGFQRYIRDCSEAHIEGRVPSKDKTHSAAGALHAIDALASRHGPAGKLAAPVLAYLIAGHHAGLADWHGALKGRLASDDARREYADALSAAPTAILETDIPLNLKDAVPGGILTPGAFALWLRMLFSALVDADFLDTEAFMDAGKADARGDFPTLSEMHSAYNAHMACFAADTQVRLIRADILRQ